jgi:hypothetical protein
MADDRGPIAENRESKGREWIIDRRPAVSDRILDLDL